MRSNLSMYEGGPYYLVRYNDKLLALLEKGSEQIKDVYNSLPSPTEQKILAPAIRFVFPTPPSTSGEAIKLQHLIDAFETHDYKNYHLLDFIYVWKRGPQQRMTNYLVRSSGTDLHKVAKYVYKDTPNDTTSVLKELNEAIDSGKNSLFMLAAFYAHDHGLWDKVSKKLKAHAAADPNLAVLYAYLVENRFESAETTIMKDPKAASDYALFVLKKRWPEAEDTIRKSVEATRAYARQFGKTIYKKLKSHDEDFEKNEFPKLVERGEVVFDAA